MMKRFDMRVSHAVCFTAMFGGAVVYAEPNKVLYELQERCGRQAADTFKKEIGGNITDTSQGQMVANLENHYSARLNKCLKGNDHPAREGWKDEDGPQAVRSS